MRVVRVGTSTNYNFTKAENVQLVGFQQAYPHDLFFVNSNGETEPEAVIDGTPTVLTLNPYLDRFEPPQEELVRWANIKWVRVKAVHAPKQDVYWATRAALEWAEDHGLPVVWTMMRFFSRNSLEKYSWAPDEYERHGNEYFPPATLGEAIAAIKAQAKIPFHVCDPVGGGCATCNLCSILTFGVDAPVYGLNLSSSLPAEGGHCTKNCPDCWAKRALQRAGTGGRPKCDVIFRNTKQKKGVRKG